MTTRVSSPGLLSGGRVQRAALCFARQSTLAAAALLLAGYVAVAVWLTWPLARHLTTHLPAPRPDAYVDTLLTAWVLGWTSHALAAAPTHLAAANIYHPAPYALFYGPTDLGVVPYFLPPFLVTGNPALALNLTFLGGVALSAWALHRTVLHWTASHAAGFIAAWTFLMTRWTLWTWIAIVPSWAILFYWPSILRRAGTGARRGLPFVGLLVLQGLVDLYMVVAVLVPLGLLAVGRLATRRTQAHGRSLIVSLVLAAGVLTMANAGYLIIRAQNPGLSRQTVWQGYPRPVELPWGPLRDAAPTGVPAVVFGVIATGALAARSRHTCGAREMWTHGLLWTLAGPLLSFTPHAIWNGHPITLPHAMFAPVYEVLRIPSRLGVAALMGLCTLAGAAVAECVWWIERLRLPGRPAFLMRMLLVALLAGAMYLDYTRGIGEPAAVQRQRLPASYPLTAAIVPSGPLMAALRTYDGPLLDLPVGPTWLAVRFHAEAMYRSLFHWRPLLNGYDGYFPAAFPELMALADRLPDPVALATLRAQTGLAAILVHTAALDSEARARWLRCAGGAEGLRLVEWQGEEMLFSIE